MAIHKCQHFHECTNHTHSGGGGGGVCENQHFVHTLLTFWPDFFNFHGDFWHSKNVDVYSFGGLTKCLVCTVMKMLTFMDGP